MVFMGHFWEIEVDRREINFTWTFKHQQVSGSVIICVGDVYASKNRNSCKEHADSTMNKLRLKLETRGNHATGY